MCIVNQDDSNIHESSDRSLIVAWLTSMIEGPGVADPGNCHATGYARRLAGVGAEFGRR